MDAFQGGDTVVQLIHPVDRGQATIILQVEPDWNKNRQPQSLNESLVIIFIPDDNTETKHTWVKYNHQIYCVVYCEL